MKINDKSLKNIKYFFITAYLQINIYKFIRHENHNSTKRRKNKSGVCSNTYMISPLYVTDSRTSANTLSTKFPELFRQDFLKTNTAKR